MTAVEPKKCGIKLDPPSLVLFYTDDKDVLHKRTMPIRKLPKHGSINFVLMDLKMRHERYLSSLPPTLLERLVRILQERIKGVPKEEALDIVKKEFTINPEEDLNKLGDSELQKKKAIMEETFESNRRKPGDPDYKYDIEVEFPQEEVVESGWDSGEELPLEF